LPPAGQQASDPRTQAAIRWIGHRHRWNSGGRRGRPNVAQPSGPALPRRLTMLPHCPNCNVDPTPRELEAGECDLCGFKFHARAAPTGPAPSPPANPAPAPPPGLGMVVFVLVLGLVVLGLGGALSWYAWQEWERQAETERIHREGRSTL